MTTCNITEAARLLKVHEETVAEMIRECKIPAAKVGRAWVMLERDVLDYIELQIRRQTAEMIDITGLREDKRPQSSTIVHALLDRLEAAEKERDTLRAKIEQMEKQRDGLLGALRVIAARPARDEGRNNWEAIVWESISFAEEAIALCDEPDVHPAPSVPDDILRDAVRYRFLRAAKNIPISSKAAHDPVVYDEAIDAAMLAVALEAKP